MTKCNCKKEPQTIKYYLNDQTKNWAVLNYFCSANFSNSKLRLLILKKTAVKKVRINGNYIIELYI